MCGRFCRLSESSVGTVWRKLAWLPLAGVLPLLGLGCAPFAMLTAPAPIVPTAALKGVQIALVEFVPLPKTYPIGAKRFFPTLTGELYEEEREVQRPGTAMTRAEAMTSIVRKKVVVRTFVPRDHLSILTETLLLAMSEKGIDAQRLPSVAAAHKAGARLIVSGALKEFKVGQVSDGIDFQQEADHTTSGRADIRVAVLILSGHTGSTLWEGDIHSMVTHSKIFTNALHAIWINALNIDEASLHAFRTLLAMASYNVAARLVDELEKSAALLKGDAER